VRIQNPLLSNVDPPLFIFCDFFLLYHEPLPEVHRGASVQSLVGVGVQVEKDFKHVEHAGHLREEQHPVPTSLQIPQKRR